MRETIEACVLRAKASRRASVVFIGSTAKHNNPPFLIGPVRESERFTGCSFIIRDYRFVKQICDLADGKVDYVLVDAEDKSENAINLAEEALLYVKKSKIKMYKGNDITALACDLLVSEWRGNLKGKKVSIIGAGNLGLKVAMSFVERGANVYISRRDDKTEFLAKAINMIKNRYASGMVYSENNAALSAQNADVLIGFTQGYPVIDRKMIASLAEDALVIDGGIGTITDEAIAAARHAKLSMIRLDVRIVFPYVIDSVLFTERFLSFTAGTVTEAGKTYVAGGFIGGEGDIVVDRIVPPRTIIGIADGKGGIGQYQQTIHTQKNEPD